MNKDMKQIIESIKKLLLKEQARPLGRWNIEYCTKKINHKIDLSNEDHCGPCGQYILTKLTDTNNELKTQSKYKNIQDKNVYPRNNV